MYSTYDEQNFELIPYSFNNKHNDFLRYDGDYMKINFKDSLDINMICYYIFNRSELSFSLGSKNNNISLDNLDIKVSSSKHGSLDLKISSSKIKSSSKKYLTFSKTIYLGHPNNVFYRIKNDTVSVYIDDQKFEFLSPKTD